MPKFPHANSDVQRVNKLSKRDSQTGMTIQDRKLLGITSPLLTLVLEENPIKRDICEEEEDEGDEGRSCLVADQTHMVEFDRQKKP